MPPLFFPDCKTVRAAWWRGAEVKRLRDSSQIEILYLPLERGDELGLDRHPSQGCFLALQQEGLDQATVVTETRAPIRRGVWEKDRSTRRCGVLNSTPTILDPGRQSDRIRLARRLFE